MHIGRAPSCVKCTRGERACRCRADGVRCSRQCFFFCQFCVLLTPLYRAAMIFWVVQQHWPTTTRVFQTLSSQPRLLLSHRTFSQLSIFSELISFFFFININRTSTNSQVAPSKSAPPNSNNYYLKKPLARFSHFCSFFFFL